MMKISKELADEIRDMLHDIQVRIYNSLPEDTSPDLIEYISRRGFDRLDEWEDIVR